MIARSNRIAILRVDGQAFLEFVKRPPDVPVWVVANHLPADATFVRAGHDSTGQLVLVVSSETFEDVPNNGIIPELEAPVFERITS